MKGFALVPSVKNKSHASTGNILPEGDYPFHVDRIDRDQSVSETTTRVKRSAVIHMRVDGGVHGEAQAQVRLCMCRAHEALIAGFLRSIGAYRLGEVNVLAWPDFVDSRGWGHFRPEHVMEDDQRAPVNALVRFIDFQSSETQEANSLPFFGNLCRLWLSYYYVCACAMLNITIIVTISS